MISVNGNQTFRIIHVLGKIRFWDYSLNANSLSSDINEAHIMKKKTRKSDTVVNSDQRNKASVHLKVKYLSIGVNTIPDEGPLLETSNLFLSPR